MRLAIVVPVLNEAATIEASLARLAPLRARGARLIVVDGGSDDDTAARAAPLADRLLAAPRGRASQMNAGAQTDEAAQADVLLFLHADTRLPEDADRIVARALADGAHCWGRFDVRLDADGARLRLVETLMNWRSRATGIATGDQAIFVTRAAFGWLHGFAPLPLMEDVDFSARAKRLTRPAALRERVLTSARRWQRHGLWRTVALMWWLRLSYFFGADPAALARRYRDAR
ncbi:MAG: TIGR04283 family arsenosugar biosynthesis glycosyltransferase [Burkholderiales bacterium]|jgi:rSAM/selenodomain-associated transferase 2|nr:TIGR04283 family arsenosugar biosynthesis glycosyltransferase [Burkholderiales bacterium]